MFNKDKDLFIEYKKLKNFINGLNTQDETEIPLMYLIQALFPNAFKRFDKNFRDEYTKGYLQGLEEGKKENKNDFKINSR